MSVIRQRISESNYYVKRLISNHMRKFIENGGRNEDVYDLVFNMLFEKEYVVFEDASSSICSIASRRGEPRYLTRNRLNILMDYISGHEETEHLDKVSMALRLLEFCTKLGKASNECFELLRDEEAYDAIFKLYMKEDVLVKLNCLEILDAMIPLIKKLKFESKASREFVAHAVSLFTKRDLDVEADMVTGPLLRFFSTIVLIENVLNESETELFSKCVAENLLNANSKSVQYYSSLACFGPMYVRGLLDEEVSEKFLNVVRSCTHEDTLYSCLESLQFVADSGDESKRKFISEAAKNVIHAISKFPFGEVREACFQLLLSSLEFEGVTELLVSSELESRLLSTQENNYETTLTKRRLIKKFLASVEEKYRDSTSPLPESVVRSLRGI
ncbi:conserved hypothetical protein [Theileria orientalis strain Shintoku]|uniref:Uncharacterized protein n=1 Tax=Theileria orientalis strain Shintoku TaxID=869250 RepID=J4C3Q0_THEOR|nr:conserved hypothetical protein [Theileria orientalis strain Shintoku]BAM40826.1 conserved hypothetical protein [Theileria orientalis strain Shintoku]|eukprot:XP_009691127.1 conserved hypothetical protein [Theileria orientalis strain Shintoku]